MLEELIYDQYNGFIKVIDHQLNRTMSEAVSSFEERLLDVILEMRPIDSAINNLYNGDGND